MVKEYIVQTFVHLLMNNVVCFALTSGLFCARVYAKCIWLDEWCVERIISNMVSGIPDQMLKINVTYCKLIDKALDYWPKLFVK